MQDDVNSLAFVVICIACQQRLIEVGVCSIKISLKRLRTVKDAEPFRMTH